MDFRVIIPARYDSSRLPGKVLRDIAGRPMLQHVYDKAVDSGAESVVIATDDERIADVAEGFGALVSMTSSDHQSGTERLCEAVQALEYDPDEIIIGLQADEPLIPIPMIHQLVEDLVEHDNIKVASLCIPINDIDALFDPNVVKVILSRRHFAMYFSRAPIPWDRSTFDSKEKIKLDGQHFRHVGMYGYRVSFLLDYINWSGCPLESIELLEQLKILWNGGRIHMNITKTNAPSGVDTEEHLEYVRGELEDR